MRILGYRATHTLIEEGACPWRDRPARARDLLEKWLTDRYDFKAVDDFDYIGSLFFPIFREIDRAFPDSLFILTVRDPAAWLVSIRRFMKGYRHASAAGPLDLNIGMVIRLGILGHLMTTDDSKLLAAFEAHNEAVLSHFGSSRRLLVIDICRGEGWKEICTFLGSSVPAVPFPHANKAAS